jgi:hypothetical protein
LVLTIQMLTAFKQPRNFRLLSEDANPLQARLFINSFIVDVMDDDVSAGIYAWFKRNFTLRM